MPGGMHRQVGNGKFIQFFNDPWILKEVTFKPKGLPGRPLEEGLMVERFITPSLSWNVAELKKYVTNEDIQIIYALPINVRSEEDKWIWHYENKVEYTVKSGNKLAMLQWVGSTSSSTN